MQLLTVLLGLLAGTLQLAACSWQLRGSTGEHCEVLPEAHKVLQRWNCGAECGCLFR